MTKYYEGKVWKVSIIKETGVIFKELDFKNLRKALNILIFVNYPKLTTLAEYLNIIPSFSCTTILYGSIHKRLRE